MATTTSKSQSQLSQFSTPQEALTPSVGVGPQMVYEFRWVLEQIRSGDLNEQSRLEIIETLARGLGWIEHDVFEQATDVTALSVASGGQQGRS